MFSERIYEKMYNGSRSSPHMVNIPRALFTGREPRYHVAIEARRELPFPTAGGVVRIEGTDTVARQDAFSRVPSFLTRFLTN